MSINNFSTDLFAFNVNGRDITDWGENATPYNDEPIDPRASLRRGQGGNATLLNRINPGRRVTISLNPGSPDSAFMQGLLNSGAVISCGKTQIGTLEGAVGTEGAIVNDGTVGRAGSTITDDVYIMEFNVWSSTKGGE